MKTNQATKAETDAYLAEARDAGRSAFDHYFATSTLADIAARIASNASEFDDSVRVLARERRSTVREVVSWIK